MSRINVLALCDYQADFLAQTILTGLWEMNNVEVYEMPILQSVRGRIDQGYDLPDGTRGMTGCTGYLQPNPLPEQTHTEEEILDLGEQHFDLIVATSTRDYVSRSLQTLSGNGWKIDDKLVICNGEDHPIVDQETINRWKPRVFFKRELLSSHPIQEYTDYHKIPVMPLQFGAFTRSLPNIDTDLKTLDLFVSLGRTNPIRDSLLSACLDAVYERNVCPPDLAWLATNSNSPLFTEHKYGGQLHDLSSWTPYMVRQGGAKIGISVVGFGRDCLHSWELFSQNTFALYQDTGLHIPYPFKNEEHCLYISEGDFPRIDQLIGTILKNDQKRERIARAGRDWCHLHHSTRARAEYLIDISMKVLGGEKISLEEYGL